MPLTYEDAYYSSAVNFIAGVDEAGRGPLAGPVVACAVVFPRAYINNEINDSKKLSDKKRRRLFPEIVSNCLSYGIGIVEPETIDEINIYQATKRAMRMAIANLTCPIDCIMTDAMPLSGYEIPLYSIIKGDAKVWAIAAASIIAKVTRDDLMLNLDKQYPQYGFARNKGYPTKEHVAALLAHGLVSGVHRLTYAPVRSCLFQKQALL